MKTSLFQYRSDTEQVIVCAGLEVEAQSKKIRLSSKAFLYIYIFILGETISISNMTSSTRLEPRATVVGVK